MDAYLIKRCAPLVSHPTAAYSDCEEREAFSPESAARTTAMLGQILQRLGTVAEKLEDDGQGHVLNALAHRLHARVELIPRHVPAFTPGGQIQPVSKRRPVLY